MIRSVRIAVLFCLAGTLAVMALAAGTPQNSRTITALAGAGGAIAPSGAVSVSNGSDQTFTITTTGKFKVDEVMVDGVSVGAVSTYTFKKVKLDHQIDVTFITSEPGGDTPRRLPG
jgi:cytochrome oxidase Cu insertion factor (SCO1/SenC/PrrC family)